MVQEYSENWLTEAMLTEMINTSIKQISAESLVLRKLFNSTISDENHISLPDDFLNSIALKINGKIYRKVNFEDIEFLSPLDKAHYVINNNLYLNEKTSGDVELLYNYFPEELVEDDDTLDPMFNGFELMIAYHVVSELHGMDGKTEEQGFKYRIFQTHLNTFKRVRTSSEMGIAIFKKINTTSFWGGKR